jgi:hypothetical protein
MASMSISREISGAAKLEVSINPFKIAVMKPFMSDDIGVLLNV